MFERNENINIRMPFKNSHMNKYFLYLPLFYNKSTYTILKMMTDLPDSSQCMYKT